MRAYPVEREVQVPIRAFIYIYTLCIRAARALASLYICTGAPEPSMLENAISPKISSADTSISWATWKGYEKSVQQCSHVRAFPLCTH